VETGRQNRLSKGNCRRYCEAVHRKRKEGMDLEIHRKQVKSAVPQECEGGGVGRIQDYKRSTKLHLCAECCDRALTGCPP
jgi:hypothetical protein